MIHCQLNMMFRNPSSALIVLLNRYIWKQKFCCYCFWPNADADVVDDDDDDTQ